MTPTNFPIEDEIRNAYHQGEEAIVALFREMVLNMNILAERVQKLEDRLAKNSSNSGKPPSSDGLPVPGTGEQTVAQESAEAPQEEKRWAARA